MNSSSRFASLGALIAFALLGAGCPPSQPQQGQPLVAGQAGYPQQPGYPQQQPGYPPQQPGYAPQQPGYPQQPQPGYPQQPQPGYAPQPGAPQPGYAPQPGAPQPGYPPQPGAPQPQPGAPQPQPGQPAQPGIPGLPFPIPGFPAPGAPAAGGGGGGTATPIDPNFAAAATVPLMAFANSEAPGMQKEGNMIAGQFTEGQSLEQALTIQPGKCYTVVSVGAGIQEVDITMVATTPIPGQSPQLGKDTTQGAQASLGGKGNCVKLAFIPFPVQAKYVITATRGAGIAAAQLYVK